MEYGSAKRLIKLIIGIIVLVPLTLILLVVGAVVLTAPAIGFDEYEWKKTDDGYSAEITTSRAQTICICGGYTCPSGAPDGFNSARVEPTSVGFEGWMRHRFDIVKDPESGDDPNGGRFVYGDQACVTKNRDEILFVFLEEITTENTQKPQKLRLTIE